MLSLVLFLTACGDPRCPEGGTFVEADGTSFCELEGQRHGDYVEEIDGVVVLQAHYDHGVLDGPWLAKWPDGTDKELGAYTDGLPSGLWQRWAEDGAALVDREIGLSEAPPGVPELPLHHPDPAVVHVLDLGSAVGTAQVHGDLVVAVTPAGLVGVHAHSGEAQWVAKSPQILLPALRDGLRTAIAMTTGGDAFVVWLGNEQVTWELLHLGASADPRPVANDFGIVWVDREGALHDTPLDRSWRGTAPLVHTRVLALAGDRLLAGTSDGEVVHVERLANRERWRVDVGGSVRALATPDWNTTYAVTDALVALSFADGSLRWRAALPDLEDPVSVGRVGTTVVVAGADRALAFDAETGEAVDAPAGTGAVWSLTGGVVRREGAAVAVYRGNDAWMRIGEPRALSLTALANDAWIGTEAGLLLHARPLLAGAPEVTTPTEPPVDGQWVQWADPGVGVRRLAVQTRPSEDAALEATFEDLSARRRTWASGWATEEVAVERVVEGITVQVPATSARYEGPLQSGWVTAFDEGPEGYLGWTPLAVQEAPPSVTVGAD